MDGYSRAYKQLNKAQRAAVDTTDGPVLVLAGPGTGKTQLLTMRVAQILRTTDTLPQNILCLTFTESGAANMRARLGQFIGREAYDVSIGTYHAFGGDIIRRYPDYFEETRLERPIDELGKRKIVTELVDRLDYRNPLKQTRWHIGDLLSTVSEVKRGLLTPAKLRAISKSNLQTITTLSPLIHEALADHVKRLPSKIAVATPIFEAIQQALQKQADKDHDCQPFQSIAQLANDELERALEDAASLQKTTPLTRWKNSWLAKDEQNGYILAGALEARRLSALAGVLEDYEMALAEKGLYDFDDMILRAIHVLEHNLDLKYSLQEQYQYLLLDEFQDTNAAQLRLVELLTDNPVNERRPNVLAVGDDDQAIYAFQGAQYSNMHDFMSLYDDVLLVNLSENYRSTPPILETARNIATQLQDTLASTIPQLEKTLQAASETLPSTILERIEYPSEIAERAGVAAQIKSLIEAGVEASEIAVLAPKHKYLEPLVPYLDGIALHYEKREDILQAPIIRQLITMSKLVAALANGRADVADTLWPEVLSYDFWEFPVSAIWKISWQAQADNKSWVQLLLHEPLFRPAALLFLSLAGKASSETLEAILDMLIGTEAAQTNESDIPEVRSPLRTHLEHKESAAELYQMATELAVLRARLHEYALGQGSALTLADLLTFAADYQAADQPLLNTSPYNEAASAIQLMTVYKAKGLEFAHVFLLHCQDNVWGNAARSNANKLTLPANLAPIRHAGANEDERLRLFFVAITRAKYGLHLTSHAATFTGKQPPRLKFLDEIQQEDGSIAAQTLPHTFQAITQEALETPPLTILETDWRHRHLALDTPLIALLQERLQNYRFSATHLTSFIDLEHAGPNAFLFKTLLRFPSASTPDIAFGNAMHETMQWLQQQTNRTGTTPPPPEAKTFFGSRIQLQTLLPEQIAIQQARGESALDSFLANTLGTFRKGDKPEYDFRDEAVFIGDVPLSGKIDLLQIDTANKTIHIVDYKTGSLGSDPAKLHRYDLQLYCYALLVSGSRSFRGYRVEAGSLLFVEPNGASTIEQRTITFDDNELARVQLLIQAVWSHIQALQMPDTSNYASTFTAIKQFEQDLLDGIL